MKMNMVKFWLMFQMSYHLTKFLTKWLNLSNFSLKLLLLKAVYMLNKFRSCVIYIFRRNESFFFYTPGYGFAPSFINERLLVQ